MATNYTRLQNIFLELLKHDVDFQIKNTLDGDLVPVKEITGNEFSIQIDLEDMSDDAEDGIYRFSNMPTVVACGGYGGCGSSLNPGWIEIGGGCGRTYYSYTGCGSPGCGGPLLDSCG